MVHSKSSVLHAAFSQVASHLMNLLSSCPLPILLFNLGPKGMEAAERGVCVCVCVCQEQGAIFFNSSFPRELIF